MYRHIVQSIAWEEFKSLQGTPAIRAGGVLYTKHKIPYTSKYYAYCPRVLPQDIDFGALKKSLKENSCIAVTFDVPNVFVGSVEEVPSRKIFEEYCKKSFRSEFAKANVMMDLNKSEEALLNSMHKKHRYNIKVAEKSGVIVKEAQTVKDFEDFYTLHKETATRQKYFARSKEYYKLVWETLRAKDMCTILIAECKNDPQAAWMLFKYENILYYPYGGSTVENRNLFASNLLGWEAIKYGKKHNCNIFDMWGASVNPDDEKDSYYGFTNFKLKFGGVHVKYIDSYDLVIEPALYYLFNSANLVRWQLLRRGFLK